MHFADWSLELTRALLYDAQLTATPPAHPALFPGGGASQMSCLDPMMYRGHVSAKHAPGPGVAQDACVQMGPGWPGHSCLNVVLIVGDDAENVRGPVFQIPVALHVGVVRGA